MARGSVSHNGSAVIADLESRVNRLKLVIVSLNDTTLRILVDEKESSLRPRFQPLDALKDANNLGTVR